MKSTLVPMSNSSHSLVSKKGGEEVGGVVGIEESAAVASVDNEFNTSEAEEEEEEEEEVVAVVEVVEEEPEGQGEGEGEEEVEVFFR
jgi:hypothetical protein